MPKPVIYQISAYYPPHVGGMERLVECLSKELDSNGHTVEVITSNIGLSDHKNVDRFKVHYLESKEILNTPIIFGLHNQLKKSKIPSIFHLHVAQALLPEITAWVAKKKSIPLVSHIHLDVGSTTGFGSLILPIYKKVFLSKVLQSSHKVIVQTEDYKKLISTKYKIPDEKLIVIPNGIHLSKERQDPSVEIAGSPKILFVGRLVSQKRADLFLRSIAELKKTHSDIKAFIVGDGPDRSKLESLAKELYIQDDIIFCGSLSKKEVGEFYLSCHCLVQTSERESFSTVLLEALNMGCPIVATNVIGTKNFLQDQENGLLVSSSANDIAKAIAIILKDKKLRKKIVLNGFRSVEQYSWKIVTKKIEKLYSELLS